MKKIITLFLLSACFMANSQVPAYVPTNGLVGFWPFTGNANDVSVNANHGTANGAVLSSDRFSNPNAAYSFNGTSNYILVPDDPTLSGFNDMSISVWVNFNTFNNYIQDIVAKWYQQLNCGNNSDTYTAALMNSSVYFNTNNNNVALFANPPQFANSDLNQWKHLVFTSSSTLGEAIYVNGILLATNPTTGGICGTTNALYFGAGYDGNQNIVHRFLSGKLDDIGIWNRVITACEINQLYTSSVSAISVVSSNTILCAGQSATLTASGATSYSWNTNATGAAIVVTPASTTVYTVSGTNAAGCAQTRTITQAVSVFTMGVASSSSVLCTAGQPATLTASGATSYSWNTNVTGAAIVITPTATTVYTVSGTNAAGCAQTRTITQAVSVFTMDVASSSSVLCAGQSATLTASGAANYSWNTNVTGAAIVITPTATTVYTVSGTNSAGCAQTRAITQAVSVFTIGLSSSTALLCAGNSATLTASGATNYLWNTNNTAAAIVVTPTTTTTYTVSGTNTVTGCAQTRTITQLVSKCATGLEKNIAGDGFLKLYPNPANSVLNMDLQVNTGSQVHIRIEDISGKTVLEKDFYVSENEAHLKLNIESLQSGLYFVKIQDTEANLLQAEKFFINK